MLVID
jgi:glutamate/tyrosine decarboxylase-like PLP-dependent enzyme